MTGYWDWEPARGRRHPYPPRLRQIAAYWAERPEFEVDLSMPHCFACRQQFPYDEHDEPGKRWDSALGSLERSHLVDRCSYGLDGVQNVIALCCDCNRRRMPCFDGGEGHAAILWVQLGGRWPRPSEGRGLCLIVEAVTKGGISQDDAIPRCSRLTQMPEAFFRWCLEDCSAA